MVGKIAEMTIQMEKLHYEKSESQLVIESLMEQKEALQKDVGHLQKELSELLEAHKKLSSGANKKVQWDSTMNFTQGLLHTQDEFSA